MGREDQGGNATFLQKRKLGLRLPEVNRATEFLEQGVGDLVHVLAFTVQLLEAEEHGLGPCCEGGHLGRLTVSCRYGFVD